MTDSNNVKLYTQTEEKFIRLRRHNEEETKNPYYLPVVNVDTKVIVKDDWANIHLTYTFINNSSEETPVILEVHKPANSNSDEAKVSRTDSDELTFEQGRLVEFYNEFKDEVPSLAANEEVKITYSFFRRVQSKTGKDVKVVLPAKLYQVSYFENEVTRFLANGNFSNTFVKVDLDNFLAPWSLNVVVNSVMAIEEVVVVSHQHAKTIDKSENQAVINIQSDLCMETREDFEADITRKYEDDKPLFTLTKDDAGVYYLYMNYFPMNYMKISAGIEDIPEILLEDIKFRFVIAVDLSERMLGDPLDLAKEAFETTLRLLPENSEFNIAGFGDTTDIFYDSWREKSSENIQDAIAKMSNLYANKGTANFPAMFNALNANLFQENPDSSPIRVIILSTRDVKLATQVFSEFESLTETGCNARFYYLSLKNQIFIETEAGMKKSGNGVAFVATTTDEIDSSLNTIIESCIKPYVNNFRVQFEDTITDQMESLAINKAYTQRIRDLTDSVQFLTSFKAPSLEQVYISISFDAFAGGACECSGCESNYIELSTASPENSYLVKIYNDAIATRLVEEKKAEKFGDLCGSGNIVDEGESVQFTLIVDGTPHPTPIKYNVNTQVDAMKADIIKKVGFSNLQFLVDGKDIKSWTGSLLQLNSQFQEKIEVKKIGGGKKADLDKEITAVKKADGMWEYEEGLADKMGLAGKEWNEIKITCTGKDFFKGDLDAVDSTKEHALFTLYIISFLKKIPKGAEKHKMTILQAAKPLKKILTKYDDAMQKKFEDLVPITI